ncbi:fungal-specific transcription factor domain-containing protein [Podospora australis]|uniref:Fungal-specific transcription factor domain-containing protein n=1 Tax=Podospora australis TaxID=1536484 RepID=A0AAN6X223_9PEZI|nr:fungal-specific transcription factor domain-containing protein [Podospora australis]
MFFSSRLSNAGAGETTQSRAKILGHLDAIWMAPLAGLAPWYPPVLFSPLPLPPLDLPRHPPQLICTAPDLAMIAAFFHLAQVRYRYLITPAELRPPTTFLLFACTIVLLCIQTNLVCIVRRLIPWMVRRTSNSSIISVSPVLPVQEAQSSGLRDLNHSTVLRPPRTTLSDTPYLTLPNLKLSRPSNLIAANSHCVTKARVSAPHPAPHPHYSQVLPAAQYFRTAHPGPVDTYTTVVDDIARDRPVDRQGNVSPLHWSVRADATFSTSPGRLLVLVAYALYQPTATCIFESILSPPDPSDTDENVARNYPPKPKQVTFTSLPPAPPETPPEVPPSEWPTRLPPPPPPPPPRSANVPISPKPPRPSSPSGRLPNIRQPLPHSPTPRPAAAAGAVPRAKPQPIAAASTPASADDDIETPGAATVMAGSSPSSPNGPGLHGGGNARNGGGKKGKSKRPPQRSTIACLNCRKSKIKCNNTGGDAPCETCIRNGKECVYPEATPTPAKRSEPPTGNKAEQNTERKRQRKMEEIVKAENAIPSDVIAEEVLSAPYLTEAVWSQLFDIYRLHFATELPFLHLPTLKEKLGSRFRAKPSDTSPEINLVLLGILTLTARFHSVLVSYVTAPKNQPTPAGANKPPALGLDSKASMASEHYAHVLTMALGGLKTSMTTASVERVQAYLMLGLYEWSQARPKTGGMAAWMWVGLAIRMAQALSLGHGDGEANRIPLARKPHPPPELPIPRHEMVIAKEIRRRTMFSCLILDRLLGCGKDRVSTIRSEDLRIQLPCDDRAFDLSEEVYTGFLKPARGIAKDRPVSDSILGRFVRLMDIWGEISRWSFAGGRFTEDDPPWDPASTFCQLHKQLDGFYADLPNFFRWSESNYYKNENHQASSVYVSLHMLGAVCKIMLHREYTPFIPIRCDRPVGPLDEPVFEAGQEPPGFWDASAQEVFRAARDIVDLVEICRDKLPMSSLVLFSVWTAAFVGIYAINFPHMDTRRHMLPDRDPTGQFDPKKHGPTAIMFETLQKMTRWLGGAEMYVRNFTDMVGYYEQIKHDWDLMVNGKMPTKGRSKFSVHNGGGGLEEWKRQGRKIVNNGELFPMDDDKRTSRGSTIEPGAAVGQDVNTKVHPDQANTPRHTAISFTPINGAARHALPHEPQPNGGRTAENDGWRFQAQHHQHQQHHQNWQQQPSPTQSNSALGSPEMPQTGLWPVMLMNGYIPNEVFTHIEQHQSLPWGHVPGNVEQFSHGTWHNVLHESGNMFWGSISGLYMSPQEAIPFA